MTESNQGIIGKTVDVIKDVVSTGTNKIGEVVKDFIHDVQERKQELDRIDEEKEIFGDKS
jgi:hypothetical protein